MRFFVATATASPTSTGMVRTPGIEFILSLKSERIQKSNVIIEFSDILAISSYFHPTQACAYVDHFCCLPISNTKLAIVFRTLRPVDLFKTSGWTGGGDGERVVGVAATCTEFSESESLDSLTPKFTEITAGSSSTSSTISVAMAQALATVNFEKDAVARMAAGCGG